MLKSQYSFFQILELTYCWLRTKLNFPLARLIRYPSDFRGKQFMQIGNGFTTGYWCRIEAYSKTGLHTLFIGDNVQLNDNVHITASNKVTIGNGVLMASKIYISDTVHGSYVGDENDSSPDIPPNLRPLSFKEVVIEDNVWIGEFVSILPGVIIGKGSIIGANSVVSRDIPEFTIAVGSPAIPIKKFNFINHKWEKIISK